jgi:hypothetical protein
VLQSLTLLITGAVLIFGSLFFAWRVTRSVNKCKEPKETTLERLKKFNVDKLN